MDNLLEHYFEIYGAANAVEAVDIIFSADAKPASEVES